MRTILLLIAAYLLYKLFRGFINTSIKFDRVTRTPTNNYPKATNKTNISEKDIVDAEFEEIKNSKD